MIEAVNEWIDQTLEAYKEERQSCVKFSSGFSGFYTEAFLSKSYFVVVETIPKPNFPELRQAGLGDFIDMAIAGITYKDTYFMQSRYAGDVALHFHELVHVAQWSILGAKKFIERYIAEIQNHGYDNAPLERMAYGLQDHFSGKKGALDVFGYVQQKI